MENNYNFNFVVELDENNEWLIEMIKEEDYKTYELLVKTKANIFILYFKGLHGLANELVNKYKALIINAYAYYLARAVR